MGNCFTGNSARNIRENKMNDEQFIWHLTIIEKKLLKIQKKNKEAQKMSESKSYEDVLEDNRVQEKGAD